MPRKFHRNAFVKADDRIRGRITERKRQIDISVRYQLGPTEILIAVESKRLRRKVDVKEVEAFAKKLENVCAHKGIMVAERSYTQGAARVAKAAGIDLFTLRDARRGVWLQDISFKFFVEVGTLTITRLSVLDESGTAHKFMPGEHLRLFDMANPEKEILVGDSVQRIWKELGEVEREWFYQYGGETRTDGTSTARQLQLGFRAEVKRFSRDATMELLGLTDLGGTIQTDAFNLITTPGREAIYYTESEFWKKMKSRFAVLMKTAVVIHPHATDPGTMRRRQFVNLLPKLEMYVSSNGQGNPIKI